MNIISFEEITSTNLYLKENYQNLANHTICTSKTQTLGRGRLGRSWQDSEGSALFSILVKENIENITMIPLISAYAILNVLKNLNTKSDLKVKWPNDIIINSKKLVGVIVEGITTDKVEAIIIGIGININNESFNSEVSSIASSLYLETKKKFDINKIILNISKLIIELLDKKDTNYIIDYLNENSYLLDKKVSFNYKGENLDGVVRKINYDGSLEIDSSNQKYNVFSGEVTLTNTYKQVVEK